MAQLPLADAVPALPWSDITGRLWAVLLLIGVNAFFVAAEFSVVSVRRSRIHQLVEAGDAQARVVQQLQQEIDRFLSATQIGITFASLGLGWIGEDTMAVLIESLLGQLPQTIRPAVAHSLAIPLAFLLIAYLQIVLGELCPKSFALSYSEQMARILGPLSELVARILSPFLWVINHSTRLLLRLGGVNGIPRTWSGTVTPEELQLIIATSSESSGLEAEERELLNNVFAFGEVTAGEVMVPRTSIQAIPLTATVRDLLQEVDETGHSRYPVIGESLDDIRGMVYLKEIVGGLASGRVLLDELLTSYIRPLNSVSEGQFLSELLPRMQRSHQAMLMVVDEFGGTAGLITLENLLEEIVGNIPSEDEAENEPTIQVINDRVVLVQAQVDLEEVNEALNLDLPLTDEYQTLGGFLIYQLQKVPVQGESLNYQDLELQVMTVEGPRIDRIQITRKETPLEVSEKLNEEDSQSQNKTSSEPPSHHNRQNGHTES
ncbi:HlyC/CorC family transporter [Leptolyngbya sp. FACHB-261]|nr:HlyC/CorC family transporter [Leptolyngbya sp. FACHB-261]